MPDISSLKAENEELKKYVEALNNRCDRLEKECNEARKDLDCEEKENLYLRGMIDAYEICINARGNK